MKSVKKALSAVVIATAFFSSFTASAESVSATACTLDGLVARLSVKAKAEGATSFKITQAGGQNLLHGTAEIFK